MNTIKFKNGIYDIETDEFIPTQKFKRELDKAKFMLPLLTRKYFENRNECIKIGSILCNIGKGSYEALGSWIDFIFSARKRKVVFTEIECIRCWGNFKIYDSNWLETLHSLIEKDTKDILYEDFIDSFDCSSSDEEEDKPQENMKKDEKETIEEVVVEKEPVKELTMLEIFNLFIEECIKENERGMLNFTDFSEVLVPWIQENFPDKKIPKQQNIKAFFYNNPRSISNGKNIMMWKGFDIRNEYERFQARQKRIASQSEKQI